MEEMLLVRDVPRVRDCRTCGAPAEGMLCSRCELFVTADGFWETSQEAALNGDPVRAIEHEREAVRLYMLALDGG